MVKSVLPVGRESCFKTDPSPRNRAGFLLLTGESVGVPEPLCRPGENPVWGNSVRSATGGPGQIQLIPAELPRVQLPVGIPRLSPTQPIQYPVQQNPGEPPDKGIVGPERR